MPDIDREKIIKNYNEARQVEKELLAAFRLERESTPVVHGIQTITVRIRGTGPLVVEKHKKC